jgi:hypothetical protein
MAVNKPKVNMELSPEVKAFGVPFISVIVLVLIVIFAVLPLWNKVSEKQTQLRSAQDELRVLTQKEEALRTLDEESLEEQFQTAEIALPSGKEVPALLVGISRLYQEQGLELVNLKITPGKVSTQSAQPSSDPANPSPAAVAETATPISGGVPTAKQVFPSTKRLDFDIVLSGTLEQARGFLNTLEKSLRLMLVNSFTFSQNTSGSTQITLKISAPFEPFPPIPTNFAEALPRLTKEDLDNLGKLGTYTPLTTPFTNVPEAGGNSNPFGTGTSQPVISSPTPTVSRTPTPTRTATGSASLP